MSHLIKYLESFATKDLALEAINQELGVKVKEYEEGLYVFNYSQIESPKTHPVVRQCRGSVLAYGDNGWYYVARTFDRFFNYGEAPDTLTDFDFDRAVVMEKSDGSFLKVFYNPLALRWEIGTRGTAFAESENQRGHVFFDLTLDTLGFIEHEFQVACTRYMSEGNTYCFELISPENRIVTPYEKSELVYLGTVINSTGMLLFNPSVTLMSNGMRPAKTYSIKTIEDCVEAAKELEGLEEGFVVRDTVSGQMVKIKSPLYLKAHKARGDYGLTEKVAMKLVFDNEQEEYLQYFPEDKEKLDVIKWRFDSMIWHVIGSFTAASEISNGDQKQFALSVKDSIFKPLLFSMKNRGETPWQAFAGLTEKNKIAMFKKFIEYVDFD